MPASTKTSPTAPADVAVRAACEWLHTLHQRVTRPRAALIEVLLRNPSPRSFQAIHRDVCDVCDPATVFRAMRRFVEIGLVRESYSHRGKQLFAWAGESERFLVFGRDRSGTPLRDVSASPEIQRAIKKVEDSLRARGYREVSHLVQFFADSPNGAP